MWAVILLCVVPIEDGALRESIDVAELNRVTSGDRIILTQLVWWTLLKRWETREACVDFRVVNDPSKYTIERRGTGCVVRGAVDRMREAAGGF